jgi:hypothetical protein
MESAGMDNGDYSRGKLNNVLVTTEINRGTGFVIINEHTGAFES